MTSWIISDVTHLKVVDDDSDSSLRLSEANGSESDNKGSASGQLLKLTGHRIGTTKHLWQIKWC